MNRVHAQIARGLARQIGAHVPLIGTGCSDTQYQTTRAASDSAQALALYLGAHLVGDRAAFLNACGLRTVARLIANR